VIERLASFGETAILQMDQSRINEVQEVLMVSVRVRKRAVPVAWRVRSVQGNIGFEVQKSCWMVTRRGCPQALPSCWRRIAVMARLGSLVGASRLDGLTAFG
jgi:hypothetical protein